MRYMADAENGEREVLTSLPRSRPVRRSAKRGERTRKDAAAAGSAAASATAAPRPKTPSRAAPKPRAKAAPKAPAKPRAAAAKAAPKPRTARAKAKPRVPPQRKVPPAGYAAPSNADAEAPPGATEILVTAVQAATELAQIGVSVGRQALRSALERLPKP